MVISNRWSNYKFKKMKRTIIPLLTILSLNQIVHGQSTLPKDFGFIEHKIINKNDTIHYYLFGEKEKLIAKKPLILYLQGSSASPIISIKEDGSRSSSLILHPKMVSESYHYVVIGKPGWKFADSASAVPPLAYYQKMSYDYRVHSASIVINDLYKNDFIDTTKIILVGHSEGGQIAPKVAVINSRITHIACLAGTAANQMYDFLINIRKGEKENEFSKDEADSQIDSLFFYYKEIMNDPTSTDKFWAGHTYLRWSSTIQNPPIEYMLKLNIPIYVVAGTNDTSAPIENMDNIPIGFMKRQKQNLTYKYYWNYDHTYNEVIFEDDGTYEVKNHILEVMKDLIQWLNEN